MALPADKLPDALSAELGRQYDVLRLLGRGGMGAVWLARERSLDRLVAIKVLAGAEVSAGNVRERFRREARIAAKLAHPNIVPLHSFGETPDALYFVMGYVEGETLAGRLERDVRLPRDVAVRILSEVSDALAFAHREGIVHRDVKPENILLDAKTGRAMLADFGVARLDGGTTSVTMTGIAVGTPSYMSPEQAVGAKDIDGRADIYALGVVGYRMLMGRLPFNALTAQGLLAQHATDKPADLALSVGQAERGVARIVMRALEKDPAARWARADDMKDALAGAVVDTGAMPEELEQIDGTGTAAVAISVMFAEFMYFIAFAVGRQGPSFIKPLYLGAGFSTVLAASLGLGAVLRGRGAAKSFGWRAAFNALFHPPRWWTWWWPRALRRADDLWDRLPPLVRRARSLSAAAVGLLLGDLMAVMAPVFAGVDFGAVQYVHFAVSGLFLVSLGGLVVATRSARSVLVAQGLSRHDAGKLIQLPNVGSDAGWKNPLFMRVLLSRAAIAGRAGTPETPAQLVDAIKTLNGRLRATGYLADDDCVSAAESARAAMDALEVEIQRMHRDVDPAEGERLQRRLDALQSDDDPELRRLLENQRAVLQRLDDRRREKESRRDRLRDQLVTLWMQLTELQARAERGAQDTELTGRIRSLSIDLARARDGVVEAERLLMSADRHRVTT